MAQTKVLQTKVGNAYTTDDGQQVPEHVLYRFVDEDGKGGCWFHNIEFAERSWERHVAFSRAKRSS